MLDAGYGMLDDGCGMIEPGSCALCGESPLARRSITGLSSARTLKRPFLAPLGLRPVRPALLIFDQIIGYPHDQQAAAFRAAEAATTSRLVVAAYALDYTKTTLRPCNTARKCHPGLDPGSHGFASPGDPGSSPGRSGMTSTLCYCTISKLSWYNIPYLS